MIYFVYIFCKIHTNISLLILLGFVDDLENSVDIVELIWRYTRLKKAGTNYKALCPFPGHSEKTASFVVSPAKQIWYCFGCHKWGGPVKFIMDMENCEFREAVQILWNITGREIQGFTEDKEKIEVKKNLYSLYKDTSSYYKKALENHPEIKKYLIERGLSPDDISKFHFGYADSGINLYNYLKEKGYDDSLIWNSHIFLDVKSRKDKFIGRVIFPIQNLRWDFVAFAGRVVGKGEPKYLNSPASQIYDKSSILYGLYDARKSVTQNDRIIITEGYMDTIALHRAGFFESVAVSGTALTEKHITIIKRLTHKVYLCFDNDKAGEAATRNSLEILKNKGLEVKIIMLTWAKDPDEFLEKSGDFESLIQNALSPIAYLIEKNNYNLQSIDEKKKFLWEILSLIKNYSDNIEQDSYLKEVASMSNTPVKILYEMFKQSKIEKVASEDTPQKETISSEDICISYLYLDTKYKDIIEENIIFPEGISPSLQSAIDNFQDFKEKLDLKQKEKYKALSFTLEDGGKTSEEIEENLKKLMHGLNKNAYKRLTEIYKSQMNSGDSAALEKYSNLLQTAKKQGIK